MIKNDNFDPGEIAKFEALASRWWDQHGEFKPLHDINPLRMGYITERVSLAGKKVLDVGCGGGLLTEGMAAAGAHVKGIDLGEAPLAVARLHARKNALSIDYEQISAEQLAEREAGSYDVVTCLEMLEHVPQPEQIIMACAQLAKPGAHLFFSTLNRNPKSYLLAVIGAEYILNLLPKGTHDYTKFIRPSEFATWARRADLNLQNLTGMSYNPLSRHYRLGKDVSVNYLAYCQRL